MAFLAKRPGQVVTRNEIYAHLWPEYASADGSDHPYDQQISNHKRKITLQIGKAMKHVGGSERAKARNLITTKRKIGYVMNVTHSDVFVIV
jgi:DNA-binding response OmpR family regulator